MEKIKKGVIVARAIRGGGGLNKFWIEDRISVEYEKIIYNVCFSDYCINKLLFFYSNTICQKSDRISFPLPDLSARLFCGRRQEKVIVV
jgi:hypothetical protein